MSVPAKAGDLRAKAAGHMAERGKQYDKPEGERSMAATVAAFNAIHRQTMTEAQGWAFMALLKMTRLFQRPGYHADSAEDGVAYMALAGEAKSGEANEVLQAIAGQGGAP